MKYTDHIATAHIPSANSNTFWYRMDFAVFLKVFLNHSLISKSNVYGADDQTKQ